jgi:hypothetical protein
MHQNDAHNIVYLLFNVALQRKRDQSEAISLTIIIARGGVQLANRDAYEYESIFLVLLFI